MASLLGRVAFRGLRRGFVEGSRPWMAVGVTAGLVALARRAMTREPECVARAELKPGQGLLIRAVPPPGE